MIAIQEFEEVGPRDLPARANMARPMANDRFAFLGDGRRLGRLEPDRSTRTDSTIDMTLDRERTIDRRLVPAVCCLDILRPRSED